MLTTVIRLNSRNKKLLFSICGSIPGIIIALLSVRNGGQQRRYMKHSGLEYADFYVFFYGYLYVCMFWNSTIFFPETWLKYWKTKKFDFYRSDHLLGMHLNRRLKIRANLKFWRILLWFAIINWECGILHGYLKVLSTSNRN